MTVNQPEGEGQAAWGHRPQKYTILSMRQQFFLRGADPRLRSSLCSARASRCSRGRHRHPVTEAPGVSGGLTELDGYDSQALIWMRVSTYCREHDTNEHLPTITPPPFSTC